MPSIVLAVREVHGRDIANKLLSYNHFTVLATNFILSMQNFKDFKGIFHSEVIFWTVIYFQVKKTKTKKSRWPW